MTPSRARVWSAFVGCLLLHQVAADLMASAWATPNLTLVGLVIGAAFLPAQGWLFGLLAGAWSALWTVEAAVLVMLVHLSVGAAMGWLRREWDTTDWRIHWAVIGGGNTALILGSLWPSADWSLGITGRVLAHTLATCFACALAAFFLHRLIQTDEF